MIAALLLYSKNSKQTFCFCGKIELIKYPDLQETEASPFLANYPFINKKQNGRILPGRARQKYVTIRMDKRETRGSGQFLP